MSKYTTGELAKLCGVTVRTVQYYDSRNILVPSALSEGGRRLYSEEDARKLKIICFLRELDLPLNSIAALLDEEDPGSVISILLDQQEELLREELLERQNRLHLLEALKRELRNVEHFSVESIGDIACIMENRKKMRRVRCTMLSIGIVAEILEAGSVFLWIMKGIWWPFVAGMPVVVALSVWISVFYYRKVDYICPKCHSVFKPGAKEAFWANHTPTTRKLTCPHCGHKGFCVETYCQSEEKTGQKNTGQKKTMKGGNSEC